MKLQLKKTTTIISLCLAVLGLFVVFGFLMISSKSAQAQTNGGRLITVHDRGTELAFITTEETLKAALAEQHIELDVKDAVEPALDEKLVAPDYQVNIYRARPVTIIDGATRQKVVTPYQTAERVIKDAGITLYAEDVTTLERSDNLMDGAGLQLTIDRATPLVIDLYGKKTEIRTQAKTVGAMLDEKKISLGESGRTSIALESPISSGMEVRVWREGKQTVTVDEAVAFETEQVKDADRAVGFKEVQTTGQNGQRTVTYEIEIQNGVEVARIEIASIVLQPAVQQVEIIGSKPNTVPYTGGGTKSDWLAASNIAEADWGYADYLVTRESGWNPNAVNKSSGACGLPQALPCSKLGPNWNDPVVALNWMNTYVGRYGGWAGAYAFWLVHHWY
jgi:uncharacterized protein YabE (DUF348 family)